MSQNTTDYMKPSSHTVYVGVDVAKASLQVHLRGSQIEWHNAPAGRANLCKRLQSLAGAHVICEATGGYEQPLVRSLQEAQIPVSVVNPAQVRASAQAKGQRAKTDAIDALMLTEYGQRYQPPPTPPVSKGQQKLAALTQWLKQLVQAQAVAKTQAEHHSDAFVRKQHQALLEHYQAQIETTEAQLQKLMDQNPVLKQRVECLDAIEGVGLRTAVQVLAHMPELGQLNRRQIAALAGLAPWTRDSGTLKGKRCIGGGRPEVRLALYMASLTASRRNPVLRAFYEHLIAKGKLSKVALTAVMRKLLIYMNHQLKTLPTPSTTAEDAKISAQKP
jgi:transposase